MAKNRSYLFLQGICFLILAQTMVGLNIVFSKCLVSSLPLLFILTLRFVLAAVILFPLHWLTPARQFDLHHHFSKLHRRDWYFIFAQALTAGILFNCLMLLGLHYTDANVAGIITSALPATIALMCWIILKEHISKKKGLCILFATLGLLVIAWDKWHEIGLNHSFFGDTIILLSLLPEATYYVLCKLHTNRLPVFLISSIINGINAVILLLFIPFFSLNPLTLPISTWLILIILGLSSGLFYVFWYFGAQHVDGTMASLSTAIMPVATVILAWLILGEHLSHLESLGMGLVILSIAIYARPT
ncbi:DMT family transporter [Legionella micdadei]|uniref:EamA domain-containing membrane protein RarD n=1 Tax=Legionella micdadei TaxID=451 RepID=A0A098GJJ2_LEGMI|nr:DMT family transporter [Legionella micdadei]ARG96938.1 EamA family transporter [Legionella micdadei]KTD26647.1 transmembrane protein [Legionella micdadei]NSL19453.1 DMT family transporter [Legionella micdadei]CEG61656.1 Transmembrane protein [Legionella micdadei]SCY48322.1 EamA domain-containing membrane protein RarD [Legionella micdadei]